MLIASNPRLKRTKAGRYLKRNIKEPLAFLVRLERRIKLLFDSCLKISTIRDSIFYGVIPFFILSGIQKLYIEIQLSPATAIQTLNLGQLGFFQKALQLLNNLPTL